MGRVSFIAWLAVAATALGDAAARVAFGGLTGTALTAAMITGLCIVSIPALISANRKGLGPVAPLIALAVWWTFSMLVNTSFSIDGIQILVLIWMLPLVILFTAAFTDDDGAKRLVKGMVFAAWVLCGLYGFVLVTAGIGGNGIVSRRSFALEALILMAMFVPFRFESASRWAKLLPWVLFGMIALSLSRTALVAAAVLLAVHVSIGRRGVRRARLVGLVVIATAGLLWAIFNVPALSERFFGGDQALQVGGLTISTQGRDAIWTVLFDGLGGIFGNGPGASRDAVASVITGQREPHNEYLRTLYDVGWIGVGLFVLALLTLIVASAKRARAAEGLEAKAPHIGAVLAVSAFAAVAITDNPLAYTFVIAPLAVIVALSLRTGLGQAEPAPFDSSAMSRRNASRASLS
ncbi:heme exporter protein D [Microbacterium trichothecenolyticum]|uniref:O-antigen ligase family protein n=1 Tax=Microbacterium trichothecenolyticum TaxID=69370 RepID=UPI0028670431|nr:O-antigen ligase family protein [Microbacterium trichothecenolyticum]MDR7113873.1 heme exporter protein D [Microbacterium trichothecenolyticum]